MFGSVERSDWSVVWMYDDAYFVTDGAITRKEERRWW
jgi:hypothetical protein